MFGAILPSIYHFAYTHLAYTHFTYSPFRQFAISPTHHFAYTHLAFIHFTYSPFRQFAILPTHHFATAHHDKYPAVSVAVSAASFSPEHRRRHRAQINASCPRQPIIGVVYPHVLKAGRYCLSLTTRALLSDVIMPVRSNSSSRHALSAMYPGVKSVVWRSDAIRVGLDATHRRTCSLLEVSSDENDGRDFPNGLLPSRKLGRH
jgi:hypothetical protein